MTLEDAVKIVTAVVKECYDEAKIEASVSESTPLVGGDSLLDSMGLVQICLALEDKAEDIGFDFDWILIGYIVSEARYKNVTPLFNDSFCLSILS